MMIKRFLPVFMALSVSVSNAGIIKLDSSESENYFLTQSCRTDSGEIFKVFYNEHIDESVFDECIKKCLQGEEAKSDMIQLRWDRAEKYEIDVSVNELVLNEHCKIKISFQGDYHVHESGAWYYSPKTMALDFDITLPLREKLHGKTVITTFQGFSFAPVIDLSNATISLSDHCITIFVPYKQEPTLQK